ATRQTEGRLVNPGASGSFAILAQFSPDGKSILTNGNGPGRLQLWRAPQGKPYGAELRQYLWNSGTVNCAAFDPNGNFVVTGTSDQRVLVWEMPSKLETEKPLEARLTYVEESLDAGLQRVTIRATFKNPDDKPVMSGAQASIILPAVETK